MNRARFRAWRRGFREADLILGPFADQYGPSFSDAEMSAFEVLLDQPDHELYGWIIGTVQTPAEFDHPLMQRLKDFRPPDAIGGALT